MTISRVFASCFALALVAACGGGGGPVLDPVGQSGLQSDSDRPPETDMETDVASNEGDSVSEVADPNNQGVVFEGDDPAVDEGSIKTDPPTDEEEASDPPEIEEELIALVGIGIRVDEATGQRVLVREDGVHLLPADTRTLAGVAIYLTNDVSGDFEVTSSYVQELTGTTGIVGTPTDVSVMPTIGTAQFNGGAIVTFIIPDGGFDLLDGQSVVDVDFESGRVTAQLSDFLEISKLSGNVPTEPLTSPIDGVVLTDAIIGGNGFSGGTLTTTGSQSLSDITGGNQTVLSEGQFFGTTATGDAPLEVGGIVHARGDSGQITGSFIAN